MYHMDLYNDLCSSGRPTSQLAVFNSSIFNIRHYMQAIQLSYTHHAHRHHWLPTFYTAFTDLDLAWRSQGQRKAKPIGLIFSHSFHLVRMKFGVVMKQFKLNIQRLLFKQDLLKYGRHCCFTDCLKKTLMLACIWNCMFINGFDSNLVWW